MTHWLSRLLRGWSAGPHPRSFRPQVEPLESRCLLAQTVGLFVNQPESFGGYTLFAPSMGRTTYLIDQQGNIVNTWRSDYPPMSAYLLENGDMIRVARLPGGYFNAPGAAGRIERFNWEGDLVWQYTLSNFDRRLHHDIEVLPNGNILAIAWERRSQAEAIAAGRNPALLPQGTLWPDTIIEIDPTGSSGGNIVWQWKVWNHLVQNFDRRKANFGSVAAHPELVNLNFVPSGVGAGQPPADWLHFNGIDYNPELDQIIISPREFSEMWIIDHSTTTAEAAGHTGGLSGMGGDILYRWGNPRTYGRAGAQKMNYQHDTQWINPGLPGAGNILVFDNGWNRPGGRNYSAVRELTPPLKHQWFLNDDSDGSIDNVTIFDIDDVPASWLPVTGDFDGDGDDTTGWYDLAGRMWHLYNETDGSSAGLLTFSAPSAPAGARPVVGDWDGNGTDTVGLYDPAAKRWYTTNAVGSWTGVTEFAGANVVGAVAPLAGDWNGDGTDTVGLYEVVPDRWYLNNEVGNWTTQVVTFTTPLVPSSWQPLAGDWDGDGDDSIGLYDPVANKFYLNNAIDGSTSGLAVVTIPDSPSHWLAIVGDWNGDGTDTFGLYDPSYHFGQYVLAPGQAYGPGKPLWSYTRSGFFAPIISGALRLPNGNTLINEGTEGNFFEVTPDKRIVWRYVNPDIGSRRLFKSEPIPQTFFGVPNVRANLVFLAQRYAPSYLGLAGRDLSPKGRVERTGSALEASSVDSVLGEGDGELFSLR
jgi:hypothetical protein